MTLPYSTTSVRLCHVFQQSGVATDCPLLLSSRPARISPISSSSPYIYTAGRARRGPAPLNLEVPEYDFDAGDENKRASFSPHSSRASLSIGY